MNLPSTHRALAAAVAIGFLSSLTAAADFVKPDTEIDLQNNIYRKGEELLYKDDKGDFKEIERIATDYITKREKHPSSVWKLRHFSDSITHPKNQENPKDWEDILGKWEAWSRESNSDFSRSMLGKAYLNYARNARGDGFAGEVPRENWPKIGERVTKAAEILLAAKEKSKNDPEIYRNLLHIGILQGWDRAKMDGLIKEAIAIAPDYYDCHYNMCYYLMERWHGEKGDWQRYVNSLPKLIEGDDAYIVYARVCVDLFQWYQQDFFGKDDQEDKISWKTMKRGFEATMKKYPDSAINLNRFAYFACMAGDKETARTQLRAVGEKGLLFDLTWGREPREAETRFSEAYKWAGLEDEGKKEEKK